MLVTTCSKILSGCAFDSPNFSHGLAYAMLRTENTLEVVRKNLVTVFVGEHIPVREDCCAQLLFGYGVELLQIEVVASWGHINHVQVDEAHDPVGVMVV